MNQVVGDGIQVVLEMPCVLRAFAAACRKEKVQNELHLHDFATRYFAALANCEVTGRSKAQMRGIVPDDYDPMVAATAKKERESTRIPILHQSQPAVLEGGSTADEDEAARKIQSLQKGRNARKAVAAELGGCIEAKARAMPAPRKLTPEGSPYEYAIFDAANPDGGKAVVFAVRHLATGAIHAVHADDNLKFRIPASCTYMSFWKQLAEAPQEAFAFEDGSPQSTLTVALAGPRTTEHFTLQLTPVGDSDVSAAYFEEPFN
eukprot:TRINITY_DN11039_c0_g1_i1.p1 TRINITY_DN11039_c0_g1~~TRINITY_DN11039_c0_g1_i1.p1  ORF type:complete len:262 (+),score=99.84 TRINITY_DN11039_c0_g1_i1:55-840(+)